MTALANNTRVFVYGTLKQGGRFHKSYCGGFEFNLEKAEVQGLLFDFPRLGYPGAVEGTEGWIQGELITFIQAEKHVLPRLDQLEGYEPNRPVRLNDYYRKRVPVFAPGTRNPLGQAWCYFMDRPAIERLHGIPLSTGNWTV